MVATEAAKSVIQTLGAKQFSLLIGTVDQPICEEQKPVISSFFR